MSLQGDPVDACHLLWAAAAAAAAAAATQDTHAFADTEREREWKENPMKVGLNPILSQGNQILGESRRRRSRSASTSCSRGDEGRGRGRGKPVAVMFPLLSPASSSDSPES